MTDAIPAFLAAAGWSAARRAPLAGDASARRYERLAREHRTAILMVTPPDSGLSPVPFLAVTAWLRDAGFSAPEVLAADPEAGLVLLEDFGDATFARLCAANPAAAPGLYATAIDTLVALQRTPAPAGGSFTPPPCDLLLLLREARLALEWYLPATGGSAPPGLVAEYEALVAAAVTPLLAASPVPLLRDYHAENLIWLADRTGTARVGLLDYQDLLTGPPAYDLVSLLDDARRDVSPDLRSAMRARYLCATGADPQALDLAAAVFSAQRNLKILGLFTRLARRDGKLRYLDLLPRVWDHLARNLRHPELAPLAAFVAAHLPSPEAGVRARLARVPA